MFKLNNIKISNRIYGMLGIIFSLMVAIFIITYTSLQKQIESASWIEHTHEVISMSNKIMKDMIDMETGLRGYVISGKSTFLEPFNSGKDAVSKNLKYTKELVSDNPPQVQRLKEVEKLKENWLKNIALVEIELRKQVNANEIDFKVLQNYVEGLDANGNPFANNVSSGKEIMDSMRLIINKIIEIENDLLEKRIKENNETIIYVEVLLFGATLLAIIFGSIIGIIILRNLKSSINTAYSFSEDVINGELNKSFEVNQKDEIGDLINNIHKMTLTLSKLSMENENTNWHREGLKQLNDLVRDENDENNLAKNLSSFMAKYLDAQIVTCYFMKDEKLRLIGSYAFNKRKSIGTIIEVGEGFVGQAAVEKELISITSIPEEYSRINSSIGDASPSNLVVLPLLYQGNVMGVIELGAFEIFDDEKLKLLESLSEPIGISINTIASQNRLQKVLEKTQAQAEELSIQKEELVESQIALQNQQEELRATNEELEEQTERLKESETELKSQQEELQVINEELEEKTQSLEKQQGEITNKNSALEEAKKILEEKAKELEISSKYKSEFLANMSHELRTPLNSLLILSKNLSDNKSGNLDHDEIESSEIIHNSGIDLLNLINDILDLSKIEAGKMTVNLESVAIAEINSLLRQQFKHVAEEKNIDFNFDVIDGVPNIIYSDLQKINQILKNLVSNAIKFTEEGSVSISIHQPDSNIRFDHSELIHSNSIAISVIDTGIGIPESKKLEIFEAFQQVDGSTSRKFGGTGLGLSISRELAKLLGGEIQLESEVGKGSNFTLYLPIKSEIKDTTVNGKDVERTYQQKTQPMKSVKIRRSHKIESIKDDRDSIAEGDRVILVVEDDVKFAKTLYQYCHEKEFKCIHAGDGETGLELAFKYIPDAIILDIRLPGIEGWSVLEHLKENIKTRHIPVHIMSAEESTIDAYKKGAMGQLTKPIKVEELNSAFFKMNKMIDNTDKRLLIVEDDPNLKNTILKLVDGEEVIPTAVSTGKEAIAEISKGEYDCIILDLTLPDLTGFQVIREMEKIKEVELPPVIIYTGKELTYEEEYELNKHASSIIIKGVKSEERLLDETTMFLHQVVDKLPENKKNIISMLHDKDTLLEGKKILVVDDDMRNVFAVSKVLEEHGMIPVKAANGQKAVEFLNENDGVDLVLMDIMMPIMDGYEAMQTIRKTGKFKNLPIIALTAKAMKDDREKCIEAGANDYLPKPLEIDKLLSLLRIWLYK